MNADTENAFQGLFRGDGPRFFTVPAGGDFLGSLASLLVRDSDPLLIAQTQIYLPTRRAMRTLANLMIEKSDAAVSLLPQIRAVGALDDDVLLANSEVGGRDGFDTLTLPPAISSMERKLILAVLAAKANTMFSGVENWVTALGAADELEKLLDSFYTEEVDLAKIDDLGPDDIELAEHWQHSRDFLKILTDNWPTILESRGEIDPAARRIALIRRTAALWRENSPQTPVILAGSTGSTPAVADLMQVVANLPQGCVVLPGLDLNLDRDAWAGIDDAHPQAGLKALLARLGIEREDVRPLARADQTAKLQKRQSYLSLALRPASHTDDWLGKIQDISAHDFVDGMDGLSLIVAKDHENEADIIALHIRRALETPNDEIMLVTPDRNLARRVSAKLRRWQVITDDSGGVPLGNTRCGIFLRLVAGWLATPSDPVQLLSVLRHPLCTVQTGDIDRAVSLSRLDRSLRGLQSGGDLANAFDALVASAIGRSGEFSEQIEPVLNWVRGLLNAHAMPQRGFEGLLQAHIAVAEELTRTEEDQILLWRGQDGMAASGHLQQLLACASHLDAAERADYPALFTRLLFGVTVRQHRDVHPRVHILGPLEARLHRADHIILGGLNEGVWPGDAVTDGFLSRPMREKIKLPSPERRTGLSAHDFAQLASQPKVTITRSARAGNSPSTPSRWIVRLRNIMQAFADKDDPTLGGMDHSAYWQALAKRLDQPDKIAPISEPKPSPPITARPNQLYVTAIENWLRDPYSIYARYILRLRKLNGFNERFGPRHVGLAIHNVFEHYADEFREQAPDTDQRLFALFRSDIEKLSLPDRTLAIWTPAFHKSLRWFARWHAARLQEGRAIVIEGEGVWEMTTQNGPFSLNVYADRIDLLTAAHELGAGLAIYDYKTGTLKTQKQNQTFSPQLALTALIAHHGGFDGVNTNKIVRQAFVKTFGRKSENIDFEGKDYSIIQGSEIDSMIEETEAGLRDLIARYHDEAMPYLSQPRAEYTNEYGDYDHLARRREWASERDDESGQDQK